MHDCWPLTGHCTHFDLIQCNKWISGCEKCPQIREYPKSVIFDNSKSNYIFKRNLFTGINDLTIVTPSVWLANLVKQSYLRNSRVLTINNGIDIDSFYPMNGIDIIDAYNLHKKKVVLGVAGVWSERKGFGDFIRLSRMLDEHYQVVLIGVNKEQLDVLKGTSIIAIESTESVKELAKWYSIADCFVNLTYEDNFPTVNIEALACGTPVITYNTGGSTECIDNNCGFSVKKGDLKAIVTCIKNTKFDRTYCRKIGMKFDNDSRYQEYIDLFSSLFDKSIRI